MFRYFILIAFLSQLFPFIGQRPFHENAWSSLLVNYKLSRWNITADAGYRSCDQFLQSKRTSLIRFTAERSLGEIHRLGVGYAYFEHYNTVNSYENRLFLQYNAELNLNRSKLNFRFRNELRTYNNRDTGNRSRLQVTWLKEITDRLGMQLAAEALYTPGNNALFEQRYTAGLNSKLTDNVKMIGFYTAQLQSNIDYLQHIIGLQVQLQFESVF